MTSLARQDRGTNGAGREIQHAPAPQSELETITSTLSTLKAVRTFVKQEFKINVDFGTIPGTGKPTLYLAGAQKAAMYFNVTAAVSYERIELGNGHIEVIAKTDYITRVSEQVVATGIGSCSTMESKYRWRKGERVCPDCGSATIRNSKQEYGGGFYCHDKSGGCGRKYRADDPRIRDQVVGRVPNEDVYDLRNTVLKMAIKRSQVAGSLNLGCLSELFTQDIEDFYDITAEPEPRREPTQAEQAKATVAAAQTTIPGQTEGEYDGRKLRDVVEQAVAKVNFGVATFWEAGKIQGQPPELRPGEVYSHLWNQAIQLGRKAPTGAFPAKAGLVVAGLQAAYQGDGEWFRGELAGFLADHLKKWEPPRAGTVGADVEDAGVELSDPDDLGQQGMHE